MSHSSDTRKNTRTFSRCEKKVTWVYVFVQN